MKKRILGILLALSLSVGMVTACGGNKEPGGASGAAETQEEASEQAVSSESVQGEEEAAETQNDAVSEKDAAENTASVPDTDRAGSKIVVPQEVNTIISLAPATTQVLCDLGLAGNIVAVDTNSPQYAGGLVEDAVQFDMMQPDLEQIVSIKPDIVFVSSMSSQGGEDIFKAVREAGVCVAEIPTSNTIEDVKKDVMFIASCVGQTEGGTKLVADMEKEIAEISEIGGSIAEKKKVLFEISPVPYLYSFGAGVYLNEMIELIGAENVLADQEGWISVTEESAIAANPDVILTSDTFSSDDPVAEILGRKGWENVNAVKEKQVYYIDNASSSLPNHYIVDALKEMAKAVYPDEFAQVD